MKEKIAAVLREARDLMNDSGAHWVQWDLRTRHYDVDDGKQVGDFMYCSLGAIYKVTGVDMDKVVWYDPDEGNVYADHESFLNLLTEGDVEVREAAIEALGDEIARSGWVQPTHWGKPTTEEEKVNYRITSWNDSSGRQWDDVAAMFEAAALRVETSDG